MQRPTRSACARAVGSSLAHASSLACEARFDGRFARLLGAYLLCVLALPLAGCAATIPSGRYGVDKLELRGVDKLDPFALRACLATKERDWFSLDLSRDPAPSCGKPPFDARRIHLPIWRWGWTDWPLYDPSVFERDLARIERWYRARGYYGVRVLSASSEPADALYGTPSSTTDRVHLRIDILESEPVRLKTVTLEGNQGLDPAVGKLMVEAVSTMSPGDRFDEATYDETRAALLRALRDGGHANANVKGHVDIDPEAKQAVVRFQLEPGPVMELGDVCVEGFGKLPPRLILQASDLRPGQPFSESDIEDARTLIYQLRVLSEVEIAAGRVDPKTGSNLFDADESETRQGEWLAFEEGQAVQHAKGEQEQVSERVCRLAGGGSGRPRVPIEIRVKPAQLYRVGVGAGVQIGVENGQRAINAAAQWDVHLVTYAEVRNFLGGLRRLRIEERPKLIFLAPFPRAQDENGQRDVRVGNNLSGTLEWPAFLEARTMLRLTAVWDRGPDPYGAKFIRDDFDIGLGPSRGFLQNRLNASFAFHYNPYIPRSTFGSAEEKAATNPQLRNERYHLLFVQQVFEWDTRDDRNSPSKGSYGRLEMHETLPPSDWAYLRFTPELRGYIPLPYGLVLAARAGIGLIHIWSSDAKTEELKRLGPRPYRLRGGGPYSVRGVQAGALGRRNQDALHFPGGTRSWIASLELRVPLGDSLGIATFIDAGDVDAGSADERPRFRFDRPNTTLGAGVRYKTLVGPIRLDVGVLVPGLQGDQSGQDQVNRRDPLFRFNGAVQLTIGEAF